MKLEVDVHAEGRGRMGGARLWLLALSALLTTSACEDKAPSPRPTESASTAGGKALASATAAASGTDAPAAAPTASAAIAGPARPLYYEREITDEDLKDRTLRELALMRNTIFARAGNPFRRPWLRAHFEKQPWYEAKETMDESALTDLDQRNARIIGEHNAAITNDDLKARKDRLVARSKKGPLTDDDKVEAALLSQRLGEFLGLELTGQQKPNPLQDPARLDELLSTDELASLSRRDLRLVRNSIYARRGRPFESKLIRAYFASTSWYKADAGYSDAKLSEIDAKNIAIVRSVEEEAGGPEHENPNLDKDAWLYMA